MTAQIAATPDAESVSALIKSAATQFRLPGDHAGNADGGAGPDHRRDRATGSALCGIAQSMAMLVGARALQGLGGGAITVTATALIGEIIPLRDRGRYQGALGAVFGVTTVIGPLLGGYFTDHLSWRWAFYINVPVSIVVFFVAAA